MYIKLTRKNGFPIWLNASFVVTVEPLANGGSIVVPIGDGLDYEVKESADVVLAKLEGTPVPDVIPVPAPSAPKAEHAIAPAPVVPNEKSDVEKVVPQEAVEEVPVKKTRRKAATTKTTKTKTTRKPRTPKKPVTSLTPDQIERLKKMAPGSIKKLQNTLRSQFRIEDVEKESAILSELNLFDVNETRLFWKSEGSVLKVE